MGNMIAYWAAVVVLFFGLMALLMRVARRISERRGELDDDNASKDDKNDQNN